MGRAYKPGLAALEGRELRSGRAAHLPRALDATAAMIAAATPTPTVAPPTGPVAPIVPGVGQPLPIEVARTRFLAGFTGPAVTTPPYYSGESGRIYLRGVGSSNAFVHGDYQMAIVLPATPGGAITGAAFLADKNVTGGAELGLDINFDPTSLDAKGRPTLGAWSADPNIYSGLFFFPKGSGVVQVRYLPNGRAAAVFTGSLFTNGITTVLKNADLYK